MVVVRFSGNGPLTFPRQLDVVADAANVARTRFAGSHISEVRGKIGNLRAQLDFWQQNRRSRKRKTGIWLADRSFPALPEPPAGSMRQISEPTSTPAFSHRETAGRDVAAF